MSKAPHPSRLAHLLSRRKTRLLLTISFLGGLLLCFTALAFLSPLLPMRDPAAVAVTERLAPPGTRLTDGGVAWLGTDEVGRDIFSRLLYGARVSLLVGIASVTVAAAIGVVVGLLAGYLGGWVDTVAMRLVDIQLSFPSILLAITIAAALGPSLLNVVLVLSLTTWVIYARLVRSTTLSVRQQEFIQAAEAMGSSNLHIVLRHVLPNTVTPILIVATLQLGQTILAEASLSFLGLGVPVDMPSWGAMVNSGRNYLHTAWWISTFPGLAIGLTVLCFGLFGELIRDYLDPRFKG